MSKCCNHTIAAKVRVQVSLCSAKVKADINASLQDRGSCDALHPLNNTSPAWCCISAWDPWYAMTSHTACSFWVASAPATLRSLHVMGVHIHASAHSACACHSMRSPPCLHSSHILPPGRGRAGQRKGKVGARQRSCATHNAMPKLHFAAAGAVCTHFLALSASYCIWSRLCALLAQLVHYSSRHV